MKYQIVLRDKNEKQIEIDDQEYQEIVRLLNKSKLFRLKSGIIINSVDIKMIEPVAEQQIISKEYRLPDMGGTTKTEKEKGLQQIGVIAGMEKLFNTLKKQGLFENCSSYQDWQKRKTPEEA